MGWEDILKKDKLWREGDNLHTKDMTEIYAWMEKFPHWVFKDGEGLTFDNSANPPFTHAIYVNEDDDKEILLTLEEALNAPHDMYEEPKGVGDDEIYEETERHMERKPDMDELRQREKDSNR
jgi:hypothetical protein